MRPLILITNDDGYQSAGIAVLQRVARKYGDVVVVAPRHNSSGLSHSITSKTPLRVRAVDIQDDCKVYFCTGTPADCVKLAEGHFCPRKPDLVLSGINAGSNASINELYSGTMGAVREACSDGLTAVGFSLVDYREKSDFEEILPYVETIVRQVLQQGIPAGITLNVNIPNLKHDEIKGIRICRQGASRWVDSYERRVDPHGHDYYWLSGRFEELDNGEDTDLWALRNGYISIVPGTIDSTHSDSIPLLTSRYADILN